MFHKRFKWLMEENPGDAGAGGGGNADASAQAAAAASAASGDKPRMGFIKDDWSFEDGYQNSLPDEHFGEVKATLAQYKTLPELAKAVKAGKTALMARSAEGLIKPITETSTPEEKAAYYKAIGVPDKPEDYGFAKPGEKDPLAPFYNEEQVKAFAPLAKKLGLDKAQAGELLKWQLEQSQAADNQFQAVGVQHRETREAKLREVWGNRYDANKVEVQRLLAAIPGANPQTLELLPAEWAIGLASLASKLGEDTLPSHVQMSNKLSPGDMAQDIQTNPANPEYKIYHDRFHAKNKEVVDKVMALYRKDTGE